MLTPRGFEIHGGSHRPARLRKRRRRVRLLLTVALAAAVVAGGWYAWGRWLADPDPGPVASAPVTTVATLPSPTPGPSCTPPAPRTVRVRVLNSTPKAGLAAAVGRAYRSRGFTVASVGNSTGPVGGTVVVRSGPKGAAAAREVAAWVPGARLVTDRRAGTTVDVVVGSAYSRMRTSPAAAC
ncbi:LytR C-terminal domain-containing protein [Motilibacter peucedani]|nr:LytR C-terminal domain-containing protein [Motilibacter peucedani]